jgi:hypothetical protein
LEGLNIHILLHQCQTLLERPFQIHVIVEGERIENRGNNIMSRPFTLTRTSTSWTTGTTGTASFGTIMNRWPGATITEGSNGGTGTLNDVDGRFAVAVKVTGPTNGLWHYEYAIHNQDNGRGGAAFRLPVCASARVVAAGDDPVRGEHGVRGPLRRNARAHRAAREVEHQEILDARHEHRVARDAHATADSAAVVEPCARRREACGDHGAGHAHFVLHAREHQVRLGGNPTD